MINNVSAEERMFEKRQLGNTGLDISRVGISSSFGAEKGVYEEAFDRGCNYFTWGTFIKGRSRPFREFVCDLGKAGKREQIVLGLLSYSHTVLLGDIFLQNALKQLKTEYIDSLILGYFSKKPPQRLLDWAMNLKEKGLIRAVGLTTHNRKVVAQLADENILDYFHIRYNAVHRGAEQEIFPQLQNKGKGLISFTATSWRQLMNEKKIPRGYSPPSAGDCYRFVLSRDEVDCCMMGVKNLSMLRQNFNEIEKGRMTENELERIAEIGRHIYGK